MSGLDTQRLHVKKLPARPFHPVEIKQPPSEIKL